LRILVTRPSPDGERTAQALEARGHVPILAPLMRVESISAEFEPGPFAAVLFTSANAPRALAVHPRRAEIATLPAFVVGDASAVAAREAGFSKVTSADGDAQDLVRIVAAKIADKANPCLYLAGEDRAGDLAGALKLHGVTAETAVVYRAVAMHLPRTAIAGLVNDEIDAVLHFSRRSARLYVEAVAAAGVALRKCLSRNGRKNRLCWP
jgi:uroporphyrinogen-III synthase